MKPRHGPQQNSSTQKNLLTAEKIAGKAIAIDHVRDGTFGSSAI